MVSRAPYVTFALASAVYVYGGWPFLKGLVSEIGGRQPGMMTRIAQAITVAYVYSSAVVLGLQGQVFFWELATLIDVMLLGHWIDMRGAMTCWFWLFPAAGCPWVLRSPRPSVHRWM